MVFGVGGFLLMLNAGLMLLEGPGPDGHWLISPFLTAPLVAIGALFMLWGTGAWRRRAYLLVFLSFALAPMLFWVFPRIDKGDGILIMTVPAIVAYVLVRAYYWRRDDAGKNPPPWPSPKAPPDHEATRL